MATGAHLLFFTTDRSGPGRRMESLLAQLARKERERLRVSRVDAEESVKLVLLVGRKPVARLEGRASSPQIEAMLDGHLDPRNPDRSLAA